MATPITASPYTADTFIRQILSVAAVLGAFPATTLAGAAADRFKTQLAVLKATPANRHILDEDGDVLVVSFLTSAPDQFVFTKKGLTRLELESGRSQGY
jgi:hypothetical protein